MIINGTPSVKFGIIKEMTSRDNNLLNIDYLCKIAGVSRSGYYKWLHSSNNRLKSLLQDEKDFEIILEAYKFRGYFKGARSIYMRLLHHNPPIIMNVKKIRRLMDKFNLYCPIRRVNPYRQMGKALQASKIAPNLLNREFRAHGARTVLLTDITYIPRYSQSDERKFSYLSVIMDAYTKQILAYVLSLNFDVDFVLKTVNILMKNHRSELKTDVLIHSDQGCHYTSHRFVEIL
ncbi:MAG: DDE-type integrase/transposase/recombinase [Clostridia bacterium]